MNPNKEKKKRKKKVSLNGKTKDLLESLGMTVEVVEHKVPYTFITRDLFTIGDLLAFDDEKIYIVQVTTAANAAARRDKINEATVKRRWLLSPHRGIMLIAWRKSKGRWENKVEYISGVD